MSVLNCLIFLIHGFPACNTVTIDISGVGIDFLQ